MLILRIWCFKGVAFKLNYIPRSKCIFLLAVLIILMAILKIWFFKLLTLKCIPTEAQKVYSYFWLAHIVLYVNSENKEVTLMYIPYSKCIWSSMIFPCCCEYQFLEFGCLVSLRLVNLLHFDFHYSNSCAETVKADESGSKFILYILRFSRQKSMK